MKKQTNILFLVLTIIMLSCSPSKSNCQEQIDAIRIEYHTKIVFEMQNGNNPGIISELELERDNKLLSVCR